MAKRVELLNPQELPQPNSNFSQVSRDPRTGLVFLAGQVALDSAGALIGRNDFRAQALKVFSNVNQGLRAAGSDFRAILRLNTYIVRADDFEEYRRIREQIYRELCPDGVYPPHTLVVVSRLASTDFLIEMEAIGCRVDD